MSATAFEGKYRWIKYLRASPADSSTFWVVLYRPAMLSIIVSIGVLILILILLVTKSWSSYHRLQPIQNHAAELLLLQEIEDHLKEFLSEPLEGETRSIDIRAVLLDEVDQARARNNTLVSDTGQVLDEIERWLNSGVNTGAVAPAALTVRLRRAIVAETLVQENLLKTVVWNSKVELWLAIVLMIVIALLVVGGSGYLRKRIWIPLNKLATLMAQLAQPDYRVVPTDNVAPLLNPLFEHYNAMVTRLEELEHQHHLHRQSLEQEVRTATRSLMDHQRNLASAERLAAVGEVAAGLAHELRNPIAGVRMALNNLRGTLNQREQFERVDLIINEMQRVARLLSELLGAARQQPEAPNVVYLADTVESVLALMRYQLPERITLQQRVPRMLCARLPAGRLRQVLLNLVINAAQGIGEQQGCIIIAVSLEEGRLCLEVADDGDGFPPELLQVGIRPFVTWRDNGTGLGLAMVRRFVSDLGGEVRLENRAPHGALVTLLLPLS